MATENITWAAVPHGYPLCIHSDCPQAEHCLRAIAMRLLPSDVRIATIINPNTCTRTAECPHYKSDTPVRYARGFERLQQELLPRQYGELSRRLQAQFGRNEFFRRRRGERPMPPAEQELMRQLLTKIGAPEGLEFDSYETDVQW